MIIQCRMCKRIRDNGSFRHPWPGELPLHTPQTYCPDCAAKAIQSLRDGDLPPSHIPYTVQEAS